MFNEAKIQEVFEMSLELKEDGFNQHSKYVIEGFGKFNYGIPTYVKAE